MRAIIPAVLLSFLIYPVAANAEPLDWSRIEFVKFDGTVAGLTVEDVVNGLTYKLGTEHEDSLSAGNTWWCIIQVLEINAIVAAQSSIADDPLENELLGKHSGYEWSFWCQLAKVGQAVHDFGYPGVLDSQVLRVLAEMEAAFVPLLKPTDPAPRQNAEK